MYITKAFLLKNAIESYFYNRTYTERCNGLPTLDVTGAVTDKNLTITLNDENNSTQIITVPIPFIKNGLHFIEYNGILRAAGKYLILKENGAEQTLDFLELVHSMFCDENSAASKYFFKRGSFLSKLFYSYKNKNASIIIYNIQKTINDIVTRMPLHNTNMNTWAMNRRLMIVDKAFDALATPEEKLKYQVEKSKKYFSRGWTCMGLPDGVMADYNYILTESLRKTIPFGYYFHNPQRNLYQTLGMRGDEEPLIKNKSMVALSNVGVARTGWNLFTIFLDIPDTFQDQIMVDVSLINKGVTYEKRVQCFGTLNIKEGDSVDKGDILSINKEGEAQILRLNADKILVKSITEIDLNVGGIVEKAFNVILSYTRYIKEGTKITNLAANKGVVRIADLGYAIDPRTGAHRKIDVIVACKTAKQRKNHTQILEPLYNNITDEKGLVVDDFAKPSLEEVENLLEKKGFPKSGQWECHTYKGVFPAVAGVVFWGITMDVEDMVWDTGDTVVTNNRDLRVAGLKMSTIEFRALRTRFGKDNPIIDEVLSYAQGASDIKELMNVLHTRKNMPLPDKAVIPFHSVKALQQEKSIMVEREQIVGSVVDEFYMPGGFILGLPVAFQTILNKKGEIIYSGLPIAEGAVQGEERRYHTNKVYIPSSSLRRCWKHGCGRYGLSEIGNIVNALVIICQKHTASPEDTRVLNLLYNTINNYFDKIGGYLSTKRGNVSVYGMSVRYPYSVKGVAVLSNDLPRNVVEINKSMAKDLKVHEGDVVLVERFPCLGFLSFRPQKVTITNDPFCQYTIRVAGDSLGSLSLDFDGDNIYIAALHTKAAQELLQKEWTNPNKSCYDAIKEHNAKMGKPHFASLSLQDYCIKPFAPLDIDTHAEVISKATGVKSHTGPVVALAYNIMRIVENSDIKDNQKVNVAIEVFLDKVANSVFKQKHGVKSLHEIVTDAICTADVATLISEGFNKSTSLMMCDLIKKKALEVGVKDLVKFHATAKELGTTIINRIVKIQNKVYFASRSNLNSIDLIESLNAEAVDIPSKLFKRIMTMNTTKTQLDTDYDNKQLAQLNLQWTKQLYTDYANVIDTLFIKTERSN